MVFVKEGESFGIKLVKFVSMGLVSFKLGNVLKGIFIGILLKFDIRFKFGNVDILVVREVVLYGLFESKEEDRFRFFGRLRRRFEDGVFIRDDKFFGKLVCKIG